MVLIIFGSGVWEKDKGIKSQLEILLLSHWSDGVCPFQNVISLRQRIFWGGGGLHFLICKPVKIILAFHFPWHFWGFLNEITSGRGLGKLPSSHCAIVILVTQLKREPGFPGFGLSPGL